MKYDRPYQRAIYNALPQRERENLWREKLALYLDSPTATAEQKLTVRLILDHISELTISTSMGRTTIEQHKLVARVKEAFGEADGAIVMNIAIAPDQSKSVATGVSEVTQTCECSSDWFEGDPVCDGKGEDFCIAKPIEVCTPLPFDFCGPFNEFPCDGMCTAR